MKIKANLDVWEDWKIKVGWGCKEEMPIQISISRKLFLKKLGDICRGDAKCTSHDIDLTNISQIIFFWENKE